MWSRTTCFYLLFLYFGFLLKCCYSQRSCRTPDGIKATCVDIPKCIPLVNLLRTLKPPHSDAVRSKLNAYKCGDSFQVCCPTGTIVLDPQQLYHNREVVPDISNHKNIKLLPDSCLVLDDSSRISHGMNARLNEFPFMALLQYRTPKGLEFQCGGTIINNNYILTAAHCLNETNSELVGVRVGEHSIKNETDCEMEDRFRPMKCNPPVQDLKVEEVIVHPQFVHSRNLPNDIALLRVSTIKPAENIYPVCLPRGQLRDRPITSVVVTGWGVTNPYTNEKADILQKVGFQAADKMTCSATYSEIGIKLTKTQICAGGKEKKASCSGDSGGPLLSPVLDDGDVRYVQQGIVSLGPVNCEIGYPGVYTMVKFYMDWILDNMKP